VKPSVRHAEAEAELLEAMEWYDEKHPELGLGLELLEEIESAVKRIEGDPGVDARYRNTKMRFFKPARFPYVIYYQELPDYVWIAAISHKRRRPGYWRRRKPE
jgi:toxin ParE1/3/4